MYVVSIAGPAMDKQVKGQFANLGAAKKCYDKLVAKCTPTAAYDMVWIADTIAVRVVDSWSQKG